MEENVITKNFYKFPYTESGIQINMLDISTSRTKRNIQIIEKEPEMTWFGESSDMNFKITNMFKKKKM